VAWLDGLTKLLFEAELGGSWAPGSSASARASCAETVHALEMGADALEMGADEQTIGLTVHSHLTLTETIMSAAEMAEGTISDLLPPRRVRR